MSQSEDTSLPKIKTYDEFKKQYDNLKEEWLDNITQLDDGSTLELVYESETADGQEAYNIYRVLPGNFYVGESFNYSSWSDFYHNGIFDPVPFINVRLEWKQKDRAAELDSFENRLKEAEESLKSFLKE